MYCLKENKDFYLVYTIPNFLSDKEIEKIFSFAKKSNFIEAGVGETNISSFHNQENKLNQSLKNYIFNPNVGLNNEIRKTNVKWIEWENEVDWLFKKVMKCINNVNAENYNFILKFFEPLQFSEYTSKSKDFYSKHNDSGDVYSIKNFVDIRKLSFSIQLSDLTNYTGGELKIYGKENDPIIASKEKGTIIFFPSNVTHEVTPVVEGVRYSLVSWCSGPNLL